jgi:hypothetical protein
MKKREVNDDGGECRDVGEREKRISLLLSLLLLRKVRAE